MFILSVPASVISCNKYSRQEKYGIIINWLHNFPICTNMCTIYTRGAKSQYPYIGINSSVTECPIEIILSGMTYYHHWFKEFVKSKHICVNFFQMKVHFRIYLIVWIVGPSQILLNCVWPFKLRFVLKKIRVLASQMTEI